MIIDNLEGFTKRGQAGGRTSNPLSSISRSMQPVIGPIQIPNLTKAMTKGYGQGGQLPKSSLGEIVVAKVLSSKLQKCAMCGVIGDNCQRCKKVESANLVLDKEVSSNRLGVEQNFLEGE